MSLDELPAEALACILSFTSPRDVKRLALVSKTFLDASRYDPLWANFLPPHWQDIDLVGGLPLVQVYDKLCAGVLEDGTKDQVIGFVVVRTSGFRPNCFQILRLEPSSGAITRFRSPRSLFIVWGEDIRYWSWLPGVEGSTFDEVAYLTDVCWLEVRGSCRAWWKPGRYRVALRLAFDSPTQWDQAVTFTLAVDEQLVIEKTEKLMFKHTGWVEYEVGEFVVTDQDAAAAPIQVSLSMMEIHSGHWKRGLAIDSMIIGQINKAEEVPTPSSGHPEQVRGSNLGQNFNWLRRLAYGY